ncbi:MAG: undecaprenyldiphospho-muramoylpentapeptide beta-N-acetylglucosaminyltransferase [Kordiimonas sp.]|nr:undecaprenyldiphospho-muramoylpentapeptide beta-N-acetylglucosaminyltransferase [Kordiimonas sp.]|tara:strand:- start:718 stop:1956 length:1239 start_codon:yes stop_codon:yes gene_type:complete
MRRRTSHIVLAAGGTGGHMFPAAVLCAELVRRGHRVSLITDGRGMRYQSQFKNCKTYVVDSATFAAGGVFGKIRAGFKVISGIWAARRLLKQLQPGAVIGFGGYPSLPSLWAAVQLGIPAALHEQNAVLGRVNRFLAPRVNAVALTFDRTEKINPARYEYMCVTGTPVRPEIAEMGERFFPPLGEDRLLRLLVIGGSQGASIFSEVVPAALSTLPRALQRRLQVTQQCRAEDIESVRESYARTNIAAELSTFIPNIPECLEWAHLVIGRAGASTVSEITAAGRPAILVPYPHATDQHQKANARDLEEVGGAWIFDNRDFTPGRLAKLLQKLSKNPRDIWFAAEQSRKEGKPYATKDLADLIERLALACGAQDRITVHDHVMGQSRKKEDEASVDTRSPPSLNEKYDEKKDAV